MSLKKNRLFSALNIIGLSIGLSITLLLLIFIMYERSFDKNSKAIYRILNYVTLNEQKEIWAFSPNALAPSLKSEIPGITSATRMVKHGFGNAPAYISFGTANFEEESFYYCDEDFIKMFDIAMIQGNATSAFAKPNACIISASTAKKIFNGNAIGKTIIVDSKTTFEIVGVFKDFPSNSSFECNVIAPFTKSSFNTDVCWCNSSFETYCSISDEKEKDNIQKQIQDICKKNLKKLPWFSIDSQSMQPFKDIHLNSSEIKNSYITNIGSSSTIRTYSLLALLILLIACINYVNLTTAQYVKRAKEISISKTLGATPRLLIWRSYIETAILTFISLVLGFCIAMIALGKFNDITGKQMGPGAFASVNVLAGLIAMWLVTTLLSGAYPAILLATYKSSGIRPGSSKKRNVVALRKALFIVQFSCSIVLIIYALVIFKQSRFMQETDLGFNPKNVIAITIPRFVSEDKALVLLNELKSNKSIQSASLSQGFPGRAVSVRQLSKSLGEEGELIETNSTTDGVIDVLGIHMLAGKSLPIGKAKDDTIINVVLNKAAIDYLGYTPQQAIGKNVNLQLGKNAFVIGVVQNFNFKSLEFPIEPYAFHDDIGEPKQFILVKVDNHANNTEILPQVENTFKKILPNSTFETTYLANYLTMLYTKYKKSQQIILVFSILATLVASLGLLGLSTYISEQRTKEIGIRKVLGSSNSNIAILLLKSHGLALLISFLIAIPIGYWFTEKWLENFTYRVSTDIFIYIFSGAIACLIVMLTISFQIVKASRISPVKSLRSEY